jgi:dihydrofolate reductase
MVFADISMSVDGYVAGPNDGPANGLGDGGERLHDWMFATSGWRELHGIEGGTADQDSEIAAEMFANTGAIVMGRRMFTTGEGPWGDEPPFRMPVFVVTHTPREPVSKRGGTTFTFITGGVRAAVSAAREAAGERDVLVAGGGSAISQCIGEGLVDELRIHMVPVLLGGGVRLFGGGVSGELATDRVVATPAATHMRFTGVRSPA